MSLLTTRNLSCHFGGIIAVDNVNFELEPGEIRAIIGPNGAGKSTFVSMLCGRQQPTSGQVFFLDHNITEIPAHDRVGLGMAYTFQITSIFGNLNCYDNVELAVQHTLTKHPERVVNNRALRTFTEDSLAKVGLQDYAMKTAKNMSYGHQRLLEIAMGLALSPQLLMLDEPTQGLADSEIENFIQLIRQVASEATVLLIEHNMSVVMELAKKITVFDAGKILTEGAPEFIQSDRAVQLAYLGT